MQGLWRGGGGWRGGISLHSPGCWIQCTPLNVLWKGISQSVLSIYKLLRFPPLVIPVGRGQLQELWLWAIPLGVYSALIISRPKTASFKWRHSFCQQIFYIDILLTLPFGLHLHHLAQCISMGHLIVLLYLPLQPALLPFSLHKIAEFAWIEWMVGVTKKMKQNKQKEEYHIVGFSLGLLYFCCQ